MALLLNGTSQYCNVPNTTSLNITGALSISIWMSSLTTTPVPYLYQFSKPYDGETGLYGICTYSTANTLQGTIRWGTSKTSYSQAFVTNSNIYDGNWHHVCMTFDTVTLTMYCDSIAGTSVTSGGASIISDVYHTTIGAYDPLNETGTGLNLYWPGKIDDIRLYKRSLSSNEISTIFSSRGNDSIYYGIISRWKLQEQSAGSTASNTLVDMCANANHLTPFNNPVYTDSILMHKKRLILKKS